MKRPIFLSFSILVVVLGLVVFIIMSISQGSAGLVSPLPLGSGNLGINQWFPQDFNENVLGFRSGVPLITAKAAFFVETKSGRVLYAKNPHQRLPIASLVKVMTALIALEHRDLNEKLLVSKRASEMEPDKMLLLEGEKLSLKELLYGIFLVSANDAAEVLAESTFGRREEFIQMMNSKAAQLGMNDSYFQNPTGLDEDSRSSYSSAYDLVVLARYAIRRFPVLVEISQTPHIVIAKTNDHQDYEMYSGINLLTSYPGVVGFKTGYTPEAGLTLITLCRKDGQEVIGVLLGSEDRRDEARELLDYSFQKLIQ